MKLFGDSIKAKVIIGFSLTLSMVAVVIYFTYTSYNQLLSSVNELARPNSKLTSLHHTLATISAAESSIRAYSLTNHQEHFKAYLGHLDTIESQLDTLRFLMKGSEVDIAQIDSIAALLKAKQSTMQRFVALKKEQQNLDPSDKALRQISSAAQAKPLETTIKQHTTTTITDRVVPAPTDRGSLDSGENEDKRGFLSRLFSRKDKTSQSGESNSQVVVPEINVTREVKVDTNKVAAPVAQLAKVRRILKDVRRESEQVEATLNAEELTLLQQDKQIMDQIRDIIYELEKHEKELAYQNSTIARNEAQDTSVILLLVGIIGLGSSIAFVVLIFRDVARSNSYKSSLVRTQKEAIQLARAKEAFVANMSHEMRTPLNVILGFTEQMQMHAKTEDQQEHLQAINSAGQHLLHIVNDVLDLSKLEAGKLHLNPAPFSFQQLATELDQAFKLKASSKGVSFISTVSEKVPDVLLGDVLRIKQVFFNLIDNAIKFTHEGKVQISIDLKSQRRNRATVIITVSDTGIGMSKKGLSHIFEEFQQADTSITRKYGGTGLGLNISKKLVEMQGGTISVDSELDKGTSFTVVLPLTIAKHDISQATNNDQTLGAFKGNSVLLIDDDAYSRTLAELILNKWGLQVYLANDGYEALDLVKKRKFDVVLTDLQLPGVSGKTVSRAIRKYDKEVPILAISANILSNDADFFKGSAITGYILKPYKEDELHQLLASVLKTTNTVSETVELDSELPEQDTANGLYSIEEIKVFTGEDIQMLQAVLELLVTEQEQNLIQLRAHAEVSNWEKAGTVAHKMITGFRQLRANTVVPYLAELEGVLHLPDKDTDHLNKMATKVEENAKPVLTALKAEVETLRERSIVMSEQAY